jgi:hypothetical protein
MARVGMLWDETGLRVLDFIDQFQKKKSRELIFFPSF